MNYHRHGCLEFREYVQTHEEHDNSLNPRTIGALALHPTGNVQGGYFFLSLTTGKVINHMRWTRIPMPKEVIDQVERMACQEHVGLTLLFEDRDHNEIIDLDDTDDDDSAYEPNDNNENDGDDDDDDDNDEDDDDNNNILINQPNEGHNDPGILGAQNAQQDNNEENNNDNDIVNDNGGHDNDGDATAIHTTRMTMSLWSRLIRTKTHYRTYMEKTLVEPQEWRHYYQYKSKMLGPNANLAGLPGWVNSQPPLQGRHEHNQERMQQPM